MAVNQVEKDNKYCVVVFNPLTKEMKVVNYFDLDNPQEGAIVSSVSELEDCGIYTKEEASVISAILNTKCSNNSRCYPVSVEMIKDISNILNEYEARLVSQGREIAGLDKKLQDLRQDHSNLLEKLEGIK